MTLPAGSWAQHGGPPDSDAYLAAVTADQVQIDGHVQILDQDGTVLATLGGPDATHPGVIDGTVSWDSDGDVAWAVDLTIDQDELVPTAPGDLLHPLSWNRVRPWESILTADGWTHIPLGTAYIEDVTPVESGGATVGLSLNAASALALVKRSKMPASAQLGGYGVGDGATTVLMGAAPWLPVTYDPSLDDVKLPADHEAGEAGADPVEVAAQIAAAAGAVLVEDRMGGVRIARPGGSRTSAELVEGPGCRATKVSGGVDVGTVFNIITVTSGTPEDSEGDKVEPVSVTVEDDDPSSPTWVGLGVRLVAPEVTLDQVVDEAQAAEIGRDRLAAIRGALEPAVVESVPLPHIEGGDTVQVSFARIGVVGARRVAGWSLRLGPAGGMRLELGALSEKAPASLPPTRGGTPLVMPDPVHGRGLARLARSGQQGASRLREGVVRAAPDSVTGRAVVDLAGQPTPVTVGSDLRSMSAGDRVTLAHQGGSWVAVAVRGWRPAPSVTRPGTTLAENHTEALALATFVRTRLNEIIPRVDAMYGALDDAGLVKEP